LVAFSAFKAVPVVLQLSCRPEEAGQTGWGHGIVLGGGSGDSDLEVATGVASLIELVI